MKKSRLKKWVKYLMVIASIGIAIILTYLICKNLSDIEKIANQCDQKYDHICNQYELRKYILEGNHYGK